MKLSTILLILIFPFISNCMATKSVYNIGRVSLYNGLVGAIIWDDGAVSFKGAEYETFSPSIHPQNILSESYYHISAEQFLTLKNEITPTYWLKIDHKPYEIDTSHPMVSNIKEVLNSPSPDKAPNVYAIYKVFLGQMKHPSKNPEFSITMNPSRPSYVKTYRTMSGKIAQVLMIPAAVVDIVTFPIQMIYVKKSFDDSFS